MLKRHRIAHNMIFIDFRLEYFSQEDSSLERVSMTQLASSAVPWETPYVPARSN